VEILTGLASSDGQLFKDPPDFGFSRKFVFDNGNLKNNHLKILKNIFSDTINSLESTGTIFSQKT